MLGAAATALLAMGFGESPPTLGAALGLFTVGATGYGLSLRFYLLAQRAFGAARTGSVFAFAPFVGAALAVALGDQSVSWLMATGCALMLAGVVLHLTESHGHEQGHAVQSEKVVEVVFQNDKPVRTGDQFGIGRATTPRN
jgi:drug/metabolite transporter (DMT)-like permease